MDRSHFFFLLQAQYTFAVYLLWIMTWKFNLCLSVWGAPSCITQILSSWAVIMLGRFNKIIIMKVLCQLQSSIWKLLLRTPFLSIGAPHASRTFCTFQGLFKFPGITSAPIWAQLIFLPTAVCLGSVLITMVGSLKWALRLQEPPRDSCTQTCTHVHTLSLDWSFCCSCSAFGNRHFMMAEWRMQRKAGTLKNCIFAKGKLFRSDTSHSLASHMEKFERHIIHLGSTHHRIAQARLLCIIPNVSLSHVPSYTPPLLAEFFSFFTLG